MYMTYWDNSCSEPPFPVSSTPSKYLRAKPKRLFSSFEIFVTHNEAGNLIKVLLWCIELRYVLQGAITCCSSTSS